MPLVNYCKKCRAETPLGESCPHCGGKLAQTNEQVSFGVVRMPVRDWFAWNNVLRVGLPALLLVLVTAVAAEGVAGGAAGVIALFSQGFFWTLMAVLAVMLLLVLLLLVVQGPERVHYILDRQGVHAHLSGASRQRAPVCALFNAAIAGTLKGRRPPAAGGPNACQARISALGANPARTRLAGRLHGALLPSFFLAGACAAVPAAGYGGSGGLRTQKAEALQKGEGFTCGNSGGKEKTLICYINVKVMLDMLNKLPYNNQGILYNQPLKPVEGM